MAVGATGNAPLAERWDGVSWTQQTPRSPFESSSSAFEGVSCPSPRVCVAVGQQVNRLGNAVTLAEAWDGTSWSFQPTPTGHPNRLFAVSCPSTLFCMALGATGASPLVDSWDGTSWTTQTVPLPANSTLNGISCVPQTTVCTAVGSDPSGAMSMQWDGSTWTLEQARRIGISSAFSAVSCSSVTACTAVGQSDSSNFLFGSNLLAGTWDETRWTVKPIAEAPGNLADDLVGVACTAPTACMAVGAGFTGFRIDYATGSINDFGTQVALAKRLS
jgi:hypothetical protein